MAEVSIRGAAVQSTFIIVLLLYSVRNVTTNIPSTVLGNLISSTQVLLKMLEKIYYLQYRSPCLKVQKPVQQFIFFCWTGVNWRLDNLKPTHEFTGMGQHTSNSLAVYITSVRTYVELFIFFRATYQIKTKKNYYTVILIVYSRCGLHRIEDYIRDKSVYLRLRSFEVTA